MTITESYEVFAERYRHNSIKENGTHEGKEEYIRIIKPNLQLRENPISRDNFAPAIKYTKAKYVGFKCKAITRRGKQCQQSGKPNQSGGLIIRVYCSYHCNCRP